MKMRKFKEFCEHFSVDVLNDKFILSRMIALHTTEMNKLNLTSDDDLELFVNSQEKTLSLLFEYVFNINYDDLSTGYNLTLNALAERCYSKFYTSWLKLYKALASEYNPVQNYNMVEEEYVGSKIENDIKANTFGFNTTEANGVPNSITGSTTEGKFDDNHRKLTREGNIGVQTSQSMERESIDLFKYKFLEYIYNDLNDFLFLPIYEK